MRHIPLGQSKLVVLIQQLKCDSVIPVQLVLRRNEIKLGIDFIYHLNETGEFKNLLQSDFDFGQFKVFSNNQKEIT